MKTFKMSRPLPNIPRKCNIRYFSQKKKNNIKHFFNRSYIGIFMSPSTIWWFVFLCLCLCFNCAGLFWIQFVFYSFNKYEKCLLQIRKIGNMIK